MFHDESWKPIYFGMKSSKVKVASHRKLCRRESLHSCECWLLVVTVVSCRRCRWRTRWCWSPSFRYSAYRISSSSPAGIRHTTTTATSWRSSTSCRSSSSSRPRPSGSRCSSESIATSLSVCHTRPVNWSHNEAGRVHTESFMQLMVWRPSVCLSIPSAY